MGFQENAINRAFFGVRYSSFLGAMYLNDATAEAAINDVKAKLGEEVIKKGFQGNTAGSSSGDAVLELRKAGVKFGAMVGRLTGVRLLERDVQGRTTPYLSVTVTDEGNVKYNLSVALALKGAQMLVRKLACAQPEQVTDVSLFSTYGQKPGAARAYADQGASLKQDGKQVQGISPSTELVPRVNAAMEALTAAGIGLDEKDVRNSRRAAIELQFHVGLLKETQARFADYYADRELPAPADSVQEDDLDEIPF